MHEVVFSKSGYTVVKDTNVYRINGKDETRITFSVHGSQVWGPVPALAVYKSLKGAVKFIENERV
jgi:hypothetical protein